MKVISQIVFGIENKVKSGVTSQKEVKVQYLKTAVVMILVVFACASLFQGARNAVNYSQDFQWDAAKILWERQNPYEISLTGKIAETDAYMPDQLAANQLPSMLMLLWPYVLFSWPVAKVLWLISNLIFTALFLIFSLRLFLPEKQQLTYVVVACLYIASTPWRNAIGLGQHTIFSLCFFVLAIWYCEKGLLNIAGIMLAISLFKYTTIVPLLLYFIYLRYYRPLVLGLLIHGIMTLFAAVWLREWPNVLIHQSLAVSLKLTTAGYLDLFSFLDNNQVSLLVPILCAFALLLLSTWIAVYGKRNDSLIALTVFSFVSTVIIYHRSYDNVVLFFPLLLLFSHGLVNQSKETKVIHVLLWLSAICLVFAWYADKVIYTLSTRLQALGLEWVEQSYYFSLAIIWYLTILVAIFYFLTPLIHLKNWSPRKLKIEI